MKMSIQFYITLPSNATDARSDGTAIAEGNRNTLAEFTVQLPQRVSVGMEFEVALCEILYPRSWYNLLVTDDNLVMLHELDRSSKSPRWIDVQYTVPAGYYDTVQDMIIMLNSLITRFRFKNDILPGMVPMQFQWDRTTRRVALTRLNTDKTQCWLELPTKIRYMLGLTEDNMSSFNNIEESLPFVRATYSPDMRGGFDAIYVYCDLVKNQMVGDSLAPLLRVVPVEGKQDQVVCRTYPNPHYLPLQKTEFDSVEISIKDDQNRPVPFSSGKVVVKLHFKRKKFLLL